MRDPALRDELLAMVDRELAAADALFARLEDDAGLRDELERRLDGPTTPLITALAAWPDAPPDAKALLAINAEHTAALGTLLADRWPGLREVGVDGADAAWMLAQHADRANDERRGWLPHLQAAVESGDADPRHLATLTDRIAAVADEPQAYGSVVVLDSDRAPAFPIPVIEPDRLEERRSAIGLPSLASETPYLDDGDLVPYGPDRGTVPVNQWPLALEGHLSVEAALEGEARHVHRIWATRPGDRRLGRLRALARERGVLIEPVEASAIDAVAAGRTHGGVIGLVGARRERPLDELLGEVGEGALVVMLDGIEDPFNFGQAVRALYAAGVDALVVRRSWETALGTVTRASGGTTELMPTATTSSVDEAGNACRAAGMRVACAVASPDAEALDAVDLRGGLFLLIGGERRGVTRSFVDEADVRVRVAYGRERAPDLGTATAAAVIAFAALRQRRGGR